MPDEGSKSDDSRWAARLAIAGRIAPFLPLGAWCILLLTNAALWKPVPRMGQGMAPPFAYIGTFAQLFACVTFLAAPYVGRDRAVEATLMRAIAIVVAIVFLYLGVP